MTYPEARTAAQACTTYDEADALLHAIEDDETISDRQYYTVKAISENAVYAYQIAHRPA